MNLLRRSSILYLVFAATVAACAGTPTTSGDGTEAAGSESAAQTVTTQREEWRKNMSRTPFPKEGCFRSSYPDTNWEEVPCVTPPAVPYRPAGHGATKGSGQSVGNGADWSAGAGKILWSEGSFPVVNNVANENDNGNANDYTLQLNSNFFTGAGPCNGAAIPANCQGWQQFIYASNFGVFMQYWLLNYNDATHPCPGGWNTFGGDCWRNGDGSASVPAQPITNLGNLVLTGAAGGGDQVALSTGDGKLYATTQVSLVNLDQHWTASEFNIVGDGNGSQAVFNSNATIVVQTRTNAVGTAADTCQSGGFTGETNNLNLVANSCCPMRPPWSGAEPGIRFTQSNDPSATSYGCFPVNAAHTADGYTHVRWVADMQPSNTTWVIQSQSGKTSGNFTVASNQFNSFVGAVKTDSLTDPVRICAVVGNGTDCSPWATPHDATQSTWFDIGGADVENTGWWTSDGNSFGNGIPTVPWAQASRVAVSFCGSLGFAGGQLNGWQSTYTVGVVCHDASAKFFDSTDADRRSSAWYFTDVNTVPWAQASRLADEFCRARGFVGGQFNGNESSPAGLMGVVCYQGTWYDVPHAEAGFNDTNLVDWSLAARAADVACRSRGHSVGGRFNGWESAANFGTVCY